VSSQGFARFSRTRSRKFAVQEIARARKRRATLWYPGE